jgi:hypothetical protein
VLRLWKRVGFFRVLSAAVLALGLTGGLMTAQRDTQNQDDLAARTVELAAQAERDDDVRQLAQDLAIHQDAQGKANEIAAVDAERAKVVEEQERKIQAAARASKSPSAKTGVNAGPIPASCSEYSGNRAIGCALLLQKGFGLDQWSCLEDLWDDESRWNHLARNRNTGAYGIPQAYPGSKMSSYGSDWETNPATQISWGLAYIKGRYKTPCAAWEYFEANNTY